MLERFVFVSYLSRVSKSGWFIMHRRLLLALYEPINLKTIFRCDIIFAHQFFISFGRALRNLVEKARV